MLIEKIKRLKSGKYKLILDDGEVLTTYDDVIINNNLLYHKEIDNAMYLKIKSDNEYYSLLDKAIKYISRRLRSEKEMYFYLESKTNDPLMIDSIIKELKRQNLINDYRFAQAYINDKLHLSSMGINKIKNDLLNLGVNESIIKDIFANTDNKSDIHKLEKMIIKRIRSNHKYSNNLLKQKIINEMLNLGYDKEDIICLFDKYIENDSELYQREYEKIYRKFKDKYEGKELEYRVKQKLYMKGFIDN